METTSQKQTNKIKKERKWGWILIDSLLVYNYQNFSIDKNGIIANALFLLSLILAPILYYWMKPKLINKTKDYVIGLAVVFIFIFVNSFLGTLGDKIIFKTPFNQTKKEQDAIILKTNEASVWFKNWQSKWDTTLANIVDDADLPSQYADNIYSYKELQKLNNEKYIKSKEVYDVVAQYIPLYSNYDMNIIYNYSKKQHDSYDELFNAKINYFQALLDNMSFFEKEARRAIANQKTETAMTVENEAQNILVEYNNALTKILNK